MVVSVKSVDNPNELFELVDKVVLSCLWLVDVALNFHNCDFWGPYLLEHLAAEPVWVLTVHLGDHLWKFLEVTLVAREFLASTVRIKFHLLVHPRLLGGDLVANLGSLLIILAEDQLGFPVRNLVVWVVDVIIDHRARSAHLLPCFAPDKSLKVADDRLLVRLDIKVEQGFSFSTPRYLW